MDDFSKMAKFKNNQEDKFTHLRYIGKVNSKNMDMAIKINYKNGKLQLKKQQDLQIQLIFMNLAKILVKVNLGL